MRGLGRLPASDLRDLNYLMRTKRPDVFERPLGKMPRSRHYQRGPALDQGETATAVEFALEAKLRGSPYAMGPTRMAPRYEVYDRALRLDEFAHNDIDPLRQLGTSLRGGCRALQHLGLISGYIWAFSVEDALHWILSGQGGLVFGIDWYSGMNSPTDREGIVRVTGALVGSHAIYCFGADQQRGLFSLQNSWGPDYGGWHTHGLERSSGGKVCQGCVKLPFEDMRKLLAGNGEAVSMIEMPYTRRKVDRS